MPRSRTGWELKNLKERRYVPTASGVAVDSDSSTLDAIGPGKERKFIGWTDKDMVALGTRDDGWLRCSPNLDSGVWYILWKFNHGRWANHYVAAVVPLTQFSYGLWLIHEKLLRVDMQLLKPSPDRAYNMKE